MNSEDKCALVDSMKFTRQLTTHILKSQGRSLSAGLKYCDVGSHLPTGDRRKDVSSRLEIKQTQSLTHWRAKDNHFQQA